MMTNLLLGLTTMLLCLTLQLVLLLAAMRYYRRHAFLITTPTFAGGLAVVGGVMLLLVLGNLGQIAIWSTLFLRLGEFARFDAAFYHSAVNFATLGYGDVVMSAKHRLLGPLESVNGVLMIGISTAALMGTMQDAIGKTLQARKNPDDQ